MFGFMLMVDYILVEIETETEIGCGLEIMKMHASLYQVASKQQFLMNYFDKL